jgi:DNA-binding MarR family transcriptional regulator
MDVKGPVEGGSLESSDTASQVEAEPEGQVRGAAARAGGEPERPDDSAPGLTVNSDLIELMRVMPRVFRGLRRGGDGAPGAQSSSAWIKSLFNAEGLGPRHIPVLVVLVLEGPHTVGDLAQRLSLNLATVSLMVGELSRTGLVDRHEDERDRRRTLVSVPDEHCWRLAPFVNQRIAPVRRALERMSPEVRAAFLAGWRTLADEIEHGAAGADPEPPG